MNKEKQQLGVYLGFSFLLMVLLGIGSTLLLSKLQEMDNLFVKCSEESNDRHSHKIFSSEQCKLGMDSLYEITEDKHHICLDKSLSAKEISISNATYLEYPEKVKEFHTTYLLQYRKFGYILGFGGLVTFLLLLIPISTLFFKNYTPDQIKLYLLFEILGYESIFGPLFATLPLLTLNFDMCLQVSDLISEDILYIHDWSFLYISSLASLSLFIAALFFILAHLNRDKSLHWIMLEFLSLIIILPLLLFIPALIAYQLYFKQRTLLMLIYALFLFGLIIRALGVIQLGGGTQEEIIEQELHPQQHTDHKLKDN